MEATDFEESNQQIAAPPGWEVSECLPIRAYVGEVQKGSKEGFPIIVTAWKPSADEIIDLSQGKPVFVTFMGNVIPPHCLTTNFQLAKSIES